MVFWLTRAVTTPMPYAPCAEKAFRSACRPAPPLGSVPAIDSTRGMRPARKAPQVTQPPFQSSGNWWYAGTRASPIATSFRRF